MRYHTISTSRSGHGAIFTNAKEAREYQAGHPGSAYSVFDELPSRIPSLKHQKDVEGGPDNLPSLSGQERITVYTDGSSLNNPGPGGYGVLILLGGDTHEFSQGYEHTTNNRMEMMAVITALEKLKNYTRSAITIHSDSQYTINGITKGWAKNWKRKNWKKSDGKPALNPDLWAKMLDLVEQFPKLTFQWVKGHAGNPLNERADELANGSAQSADMMVDEGYKR